MRRAWALVVGGGAFAVVCAAASAMIMLGLLESVE